MKRKKLLCLAALAFSAMCTLGRVDVNAASSVAVNAQNFPDNVFRDYVSNKFDDDKNGVLSDKELKYATFISLRETGVQSLKGVELLPEVYYISCSQNPISSLDVSKNTKLETLYAEETGITSLDLSNNKLLESVNVDKSPLSSLNLGKNNSLKSLSAPKCKLTSLNITGCPNLNYLWVSDNQLQSIKLRDNKALEIVTVDDNQLSFLDLSGLHKLVDLSAARNNITKVNFSGCSNLEAVYLTNNKLTSIDVTGLGKLKYLRLSENLLTEFYLGDSATLESLALSANAMRKLSLGSLPKLVSFYAYDNQLAAFNIKSTPNAKFSFESQAIVAYGESFDLYRYDPNFVASNVSDLYNAEIKGNVITPKDRDSSVRYKYTSGGSSIIVYIDFLDGIEFIDVPQDTSNWKHQAVKFVNDKGLMGGVGGSYEFQPDEYLTRAMFATVLYRAAGSPSVPGGYASFSDVKDGTWYTNAVRWASANKIVSGYSNGNFGVNDNVTRDQIAKMLYVFGELKGYNVSQRSSLDAFADKAKVSGLAVPYLEWAVASKMISGRTADGVTKIDPKGNATRAECAKMLKVFLETYQK